MASPCWSIRPRTGGQTAPDHFAKHVEVTVPQRLVRLESLRSSASHPGHLRPIAGLLGSEAGSSRRTGSCPARRSRRAASPSALYDDPMRALAGSASGSVDVSPCPVGGRTFESRSVRGTGTPARPLAPANHSPDSSEYGRTGAFLSRSISSSTILRTSSRTLGSVGG